MPQSICGGSGVRGASKWYQREVVLRHRLTGSAGAPNDCAA